MSPRKAFAAIALASTVLIGTTGCSFSHDVRSLQPYAPSDGVQVNVGQLALRNAFILTANGQTALFASVVNSGNEDINATIQYDDPSTGSKTNVDFPVFAYEKLDLGYNGNPPVILNLEAVPGKTVGIYVLGGDKGSTLLDVPVLDATNPIYAPYAELIGK